MPGRDAAVVLDTWPVMGLYAGTEPAATQLGELLSRRPGPRAVISAVNFAEACYILANDYGADAALERARYLRRALWVEEVDTRTAQTAAWIKHTYRMSLGDTFAAATAIRHGCELWTGDAELLCDDRVWTVRDLRHPDLRTAAEPRRRPDKLSHLDAEQFAAFVAAPLARRQVRQRGRRTGSVEH